MDYTANEIAKVDAAAERVANGYVNQPHNPHAKDWAFPLPYGFTYPFEPLIVDTDFDFVFDNDFDCENDYADSGGPK